MLGLVIIIRRKLFETQSYIVMPSLSLFTGIPSSSFCCFWTVVDASEAGAGNLEVVVHSTKTGTRVPNFLEAVDRTNGQFRIHFTPRPDCFNYRVDVTFNDQPVSSLYSSCSILSLLKLINTSQLLRLCPCAAWLRVLQAWEWAQVQFPWRLKVKVHSYD